MGTRLSFFCAALLSCFVNSAAHAESLNLLIWESYIDEDILQRFTAETGVTVNQIYYDSGDKRDEVLADPGSNIDVAVVGETTANLFGNRGVLEPLDTTNVPVLKDYDTRWRNRCANYAMPYLWGTMGILYRSDKVQERPNSWSALMQPAEPLRKHIAMFNDHNEAFVAPLSLLGLSINANDQDSLKQAFEALKAQAPYVLTYDYVITSIQHANIGPQIYMAVGYSGDQHTLNNKVGRPDLWRYSLPKEGGLFWLDCLAVMSASKQKAMALKLVDFIGSPENAKQNALTLRMPTTSNAALNLMPDAVRRNPEVYPDQSALDRSQIQQELSTQSIQIRRRIISSLVHFQ
ncbi:spermidine/putrescine transport system substrate-binding protein [Rhizobium sp. RU20A]|uniref:polyamine ABC transporter substrate-binding protein n=1 Tax=Rhizobium sp. RU20A TaxID=1907412 RepID=UPI00095654E1|nr:spermidine/putrescine ABC transporter substrate-binding protein [Rhizobium sp. RU20A]SIR01849.1 spermidine/putrescine transport system substrate-binding protein [Rhizobium sp. RU20A]